MKTLISGVISASLLLLLAACGSKEGGAETTGAAAKADDGKLTIAAIPKSTGGEFWETVESGARKAAAELGVELKWEGTVSETEVAEQNKIIESMVNLGVDGMALAPLNQQAQMKFAKNAVDAGIPVVVFDSALNGDAHSSFVATDNKAGGALAAKHMLELLGDPAGKKVMVMRFVQGTGSTEARAEGFIETVKAAGVEIVADPYPDTGTPEGCKSAAVNTLNGMIEADALKLDGIFACNLYSSEGVVEAINNLHSSNVKTDLKVIGFDTSAKLLKGIESGNVDALISQNPASMGYLAVKTAVAVVKGEQVDDLVDTGVVLVTKDSMANDAEVREVLGL